MRVLITGATDGLGRRVAELLSERGDEVLVHGRSPARSPTRADLAVPSSTRCDGWPRRFRPTWTR